jgi:hypothetical protein
VLYQDSSEATPTNKRLLEVGNKERRAKEHQRNNERLEGETTVRVALMNDRGVKADRRARNVAVDRK